MCIRDRYQRRVHGRMKEMIFMSLESVKKKLNPEDRKFVFEVFGYDFIIDEEFRLWLIEVNTNPCIEEASPILEVLLPRMIDDAFRMTIDVLFPRPRKTGERTSAGGQSKGSLDTVEEKKEDEGEPTPIVGSPQPEGELGDSLTLSKVVSTTVHPSPFKVPGYSDSENMWDLLGNLCEKKAAVHKDSLRKGRKV
eukprot:TRINITY_DN4768_c0_g1_i7.p1 TRINITY_DN4768_c0_g1~~TRINITY_DN4768_c0_g1_i7.p1  ORF type:complete len:194 (+),score=45.97 TRINITY_DN4768_c0_g1_i7:65-646(+)